MIKLKNVVDINNLIDDLRTLSWEASNILLYYSRIIKDKNVDLNRSKDISDPVTIADLRVNEKIIQRINEKYPLVDWGILSEENVKFSDNIPGIEKDWLWVIDPLDGTKDFIQGSGNYAMHLALNYKKKAFLGVVLIPEKNELWISNGEEVWCENKKGLRMRPKNTKNKMLQEMTIVTSKNHRNEALNKLIKIINFKKTIVMGSVGCKIASIVRGESDIYISLSLPGKSSPKDWDFAAPAAILFGAGGAITNLQNEDITFNNPKFEQGGIVIASNDKINHSFICKQLREIITENNIFDEDS